VAAGGSISSSDSARQPLSRSAMGGWHGACIEKDTAGLKPWRLAVALPQVYNQSPSSLAALVP
jgi:hypothetical protein